MISEICGACSSDKDRRISAIKYDKNYNIKSTKIQKALRYKKYYNIKAVRSYMVYFLGSNPGGYIKMIGLLFVL